METLADVAAEVCETVGGLCAYSRGDLEELLKDETIAPKLKKPAVVARNKIIKEWEMALPGQGGAVSAADEEATPPGSLGAHTSPLAGAPAVAAPAGLENGDAFCSLRFGAHHGAEHMAQELQRAMSGRKKSLKIIDMLAGGDIDQHVFRSIETCGTFIVFGTAKYGEDTGNQACTYYEYKHAFALKKKIILIRMIPFDAEFEELHARVIFNANKLVIPWIVGTPMPVELPDQILNVMATVEDAALAPTAGAEAKPEAEAEAETEAEAELEAQPEAEAEAQPEAGPERASKQVRAGGAFPIVPLEERKFDFFINHCQASGQDQCKALCLELQKAGAEVWYDMQAQDLTARGMEEGVSKSRNVLMFLSDDLMGRPFCNAEQRWGIQYGCNFVGVVEKDPRHSPADFAKEKERAPADLEHLIDQVEFIDYDRRDYKVHSMVQELLRRGGVSEKVPASEDSVSRRVPEGTPPSAGQWAVGDRCEVYSKTGGGWCRGRVTALCGARGVQLTYEVAGEDYTKTLSHDNANLRAAPEFDGSAPPDQSKKATVEFAPPSPGQMGTTLTKGGTRSSSSSRSRSSATPSLDALVSASAASSIPVVRREHMSAEARAIISEHEISPEELQARVEAAQSDLRAFYDMNINKPDAIAIFQEQAVLAVESAEAMFAEATGKQSNAPVVTAFWKAASGDQEEKRMEFFSATVFGRLKTANFFMNVNHNNISRMNFIVVPMTTGQVAIVWYGGMYKLQVSVAFGAQAFGADCDILKIIDASKLGLSEILIELTDDGGKTITETVRLKVRFDKAADIEDGELF
jgi:hypothetical protein